MQRSRPTPTTPRVAAGFSAGLTPAIRICRVLLEEGAQLAIYDPKVSAQQIAADLGVDQHDGKAMQGEGVWQPAANPFTAVCGADAMVLLTEWQQFRQRDCGWGLWGRVRGRARGVAVPAESGLDPRS